jgi:hypothetical protein
MLGHVALHHVWATYLPFLIGAYLGAVFFDGVFNRKHVWLSACGGYGIAFGFLYLYHYSGSAQWAWGEVWFWHYAIRVWQWEGEWFDYVLILPSVLKWYAIPLYGASIVARLSRRLRQRIGVRREAP